MHLLALERVASEVAAVHADAVDRDARFPIEAISALKEIGALSASVPSELGGGGCGIVALSEICQTLGQRCASSAMILAMHYIKVASLVNHGLGCEEIRQYLESLVREQRLIASVTSEVGTDGDMRRSISALERTKSGFSFTKHATTMSYANYADDLLVTMRRSDSATENDQVLVLALRGNFDITTTGSWDTLGMRGTCSPPGTVFASCAAWQILQAPFSEISANSMVPVSHILWSALWLGIATDAVNRARRLLQLKARKKPSVTPASAARVALLDAKLQTMRAEQSAVAHDYSVIQESGKRVDTLNVAFGIRQNNLKLNASRLVKEIVMDAMEASGIASYRQDSEFSLGRHMRDALSACLMISNDRILEHNATMQLIHRGR